MAKKGEVDPWNIDVIEVADRFLEKLEKAQKLDLRISGRVLLYAAILIRMKAEILAEEALRTKAEPEEPEFIPDEIEFHSFFDDDFDSYTWSEPYEESSPISDLEIEEFIGDEIIETLITGQRKKVRRFTTLKDLIHELKMAETVEKRRRRKKRRSTDSNDTVKRALETPHEENIEETIAMVEEELKRLFRIKNMLYFSEIIKGKDIKEKVSYYISILHLAFRRKLEISQKKIYDEDIEIKPIT